MTTRGANYKRRKNDNYPTPFEVTWALLYHIKFSNIFDPACGRANKIVEAALCNGDAGRTGRKAIGRDIIGGQDFLTYKYKLARGVDIVTNPPYGDRRGTLALKFIERALELTRKHQTRVAMLLPIDFDSGKTRRHVFEHPAFAMKLVLLDRIKWFNGQSGSTNHAWFIWDWKHKGLPIIKYTEIER